jgi:DNA-binding NtrC family response regulator
LLFRADPAGHPAVRTRLMELFTAPRGDFPAQLVAALKDSLPGVDVALLLPSGGSDPMALASAWTGELPRVPPQVYSELASPGRYAQLSGGAGATAIIPVFTPDKQLVAVLAARPAGMLGDEGVGLLFESARLVGLRWLEAGTESRPLTGWESEARHRLDLLMPGTSQAMQVLRAGMLAAAHTLDPVLICGGEGTGRTELARLLTTLGPVAGRPVVVVDARGSDPDGLRYTLFGPGGPASHAAGAGGAMAKARGGLWVLRNADHAGVSLQTELAALIASGQRDPAIASQVRWAITCGEDPLALVQQGRLAPPMFMVFSHRMLRVPRLGERREDLPLLIATLLRRVAAEQQKNLRGITLECLNALLAQPFVGEMSELVGEINRLVTATPDGDMVRCDQLLTVDANEGVTVNRPAADSGDILASDNLKKVVPRVEQLIIDRVMRRVKGNQSKGARALGISRGALIAKLKEYEVPDYRYLRRQAKTRSS